MVKLAKDTIFQSSGHHHFNGPVPLWITSAPCIHYLSAPPTVTRDQPGVSCGWTYFPLRAGENQMNRTPTNVSQRQMMGWGWLWVPTNVWRSQMWWLRNVRGKHTDGRCGGCSRKLFIVEQHKFHWTQNLIWNINVSLRPFLNMAQCDKTFLNDFAQSSLTVDPYLSLTWYHLVSPACKWAHPLSMYTFNKIPSP